MEINDSNYLEKLFINNAKGAILPKGGGSESNPSGGSGDSCGIETVVDNSYLLEETTFKFGIDDEDNIYTNYEDIIVERKCNNMYDSVRIGANYIVRLNGIDYKCALHKEANWSGLILGSYLYEDWDDSKEPFWIRITTYDDHYSFHILTFVDDVTISIKADNIAIIKENQFPSRYVLDLSQDCDVLINRTTTVNRDAQECYEAIIVARRDGKIAVKFKECQYVAYNRIAGGSTITSDIFDESATLSNNSYLIKYNLVANMLCIDDSGEDSGNTLTFVGFLPNGTTFYMQIDVYEGTIKTIAKYTAF